MLRVAIDAGPRLSWRILRAGYHLVRRRDPFAQALFRGCVVYHAFR